MPVLYDDNDEPYLSYAMENVVRTQSVTINDLDEDFDIQLFGKKMEKGKDDDGGMDEYSKEEREKFDAYAKKMGYGQFFFGSI